MKLKISILFIVLICLGAVINAQNPTNFSLESVTSRNTFNLIDAKGKYVALHFLLKTECPYCIRHTSDYMSKAETLPEVIQVFIKPDNESEIKEWASKLSVDELSKLPIYRDTDSKLANQFGVPNGYHFHSQIVHYPALILLDPTGKEVFRYIGKDNSDRFPFEKLAAEIKELSHNR